jgi:flagellar FliL protein
MSEANVEEKKPKPKLKFNLAGAVPVMRLVAIILAGFVFVLMAISIMIMMYTLFAPADWPRLVNMSTSGETSHSESVSENQPINQEAVPRTEPTSPYIVIKPGEGLLMDTGTKIINLADPGGRKYIRINVVLEFVPPDASFYQLEGEAQLAYKEAFDEEITKRLPVINDIIIMLVSTKDYQTLYTADGKETLRNQMIEAINSRLPEYKLMSVYFTEFVIQ